MLTPSDPGTLASAVVDTLVVAADPYSRHSSIFYWERAHHYRQAVVEAVTGADDPEIAALGKDLYANPTDPTAYRRLHAALVAAHAAGGGRSAALGHVFALAWTAECNSRLGYHLGSRYRPGEPPITADMLLATPSGTALPAGIEPPVLIVVPFRDRTGGERVRNLLACLLSLRDQTYPRDAYRVLVVESDDTPRWRDAIGPYADRYLFAPNPGLFNKSWAVNAGVVNSPGPVELIGILDADVLADREFVARNVERFLRPGVMGHLTYRNMLCLDVEATAWAIRERIERRAATADPEHLRGFLLRRPPGCCMWVRSTAFHRVGGMDERFEGWGGEDNDFIYRLDIHTAFDKYDDWLYHMHHPSSAVLRPDGELINAHIPALSWPLDAQIGRLDRFTRAGLPAGDSLPGGDTERRNTSS